MALSGPQKVFAQGIASGLNATAAYCAAYPKAKPAEAAKNTSRLTKKDEVAAEIARLQEKTTAEFTMTRAEWLESFVRIGKKAETAKDFGAARGCMREIGLALPGWYSPEKVQVEALGEIHVTIGQ